ncbi:MAG: TIGR04086 family membrane protein [Lachnospiraceae bacterium]|nr:TIGR04086 family membrane protein [Lachnospiraceae bacterium]
MREQILNREKTDKRALLLLGLLVFAYILTAVLLMGLAFLLYKFRFSENIINIAIVAIYVAVTFVTGFLAGKILKIKKFLWGFLLGCGYFAILAVVSLIVGQQEAVVGNHLLTTFMLCAGGGMLGGMLS